VGPYGKGNNGGPAPSIIRVDLVKLVIIVEGIFLDVVVEIAITRAAPPRVLHSFQQCTATENHDSDVPNYPNFTLAPFKIKCLKQA
jgi:hypothetical protein